MLLPSMVSKNYTGKVRVNLYANTKYKWEEKPRFFVRFYFMSNEQKAS